MCLLHNQSVNPGRQKQQVQITLDWYLMNGLLVTLPLLLLLFSSLYTSHAPILVLKKRACAIRVPRHSWVLNYSRERVGTTKDAARKTVPSTRTGPVWRMGERLSHRPAASQDYLSDFQCRINCAQLLGEAKTPRMQCCQHNLSLPVESLGDI